MQWYDGAHKQENTMFKDIPASSSFSVNDIGRAREFYGETLGLPTVEEFGMLRLTLADGHKVMIYPKLDHAPATFTLLNFQVADIEKTVAELTDLGVKFEVYDQDGLKTREDGILVDEKMGVKIAWFKDPAGNIHAVTEGEMH
jgi:catechol 2,3-dioxygenase-like lactoylglutathione lyase family enzyme